MVMGRDSMNIIQSDYPKISHEMTEIAEIREKLYAKTVRVLKKKRTMPEDQAPPKPAKKKCDISQAMRNTKRLTDKVADLT